MDRRNKAEIARAAAAREGRFLLVAALVLAGLVGLEVVLDVF